MLKLTHTRGAPQSKAYELVEGEGLKISALRRAKLWQATPVNPQSLSELLATLKGLELSPSSYLVMGELTPEGKKIAHQGKPILRRSRDHEQERATLRDAPTRFLCVDLDNTPWLNPTDLRASLLHAIHTTLPQAFHHASFVYQLSGSCGLKSPHLLKVHLFFELHTPLTLAEIKRDAKARWPRDLEGKLYVDTAVFAPSQPIYTARPQLIGLADPFPGDTRSGLIEQSAPRVQLTPLPSHPPKVKRLPQKLVKARLQAIQSTPHEDTGDQAALNKATERLACAGSERHNALLKAAFWLGRFVGAGRLTQHDVTHALTQACHLNGYVMKVKAHEIERVMRDGINAGALQPIFDERTHPLKSSSEPPPEPPRLASTPQEINAEVKRVIKRALAPSSALRLVRLPAGAGKTHATLTQLARLVEREGRSVVYLVPNHTLIKEAVSKLSTLSTLQPQVLEGQLRGCQLYQQHPDQRLIIDELREEGVTIPRLCKALSCPFFDTCATRKRPQHKLKGRLTFSTHAMLPHLKDLPPNTLIVIDESPEMVFTKRTPLDHLNSLIATHAERSPQAVLTTSGRWRLQAYHPLAHFLEPLLHEFTRAHLAQLARCEGHSEEASSKRLVSGLAHLKPLAQQLLSAQIEPPQLAINPRELRQVMCSPYGRAELARPSAFTLALKLARLITGEEERDLRLVTTPDAEVFIEERAPLKLPEGAELVALDATPCLTKWRALAQNSSRALNLIEGDTNKLTPHPTEALWLHSKAYRTSRLFTHEGHLKNDALGALNTLTRHLDLTHLPSSASVGVGTHKRLADLIRAALKPVKEGEPPSELAEHPLICELRRFKEVVVGHTGRDNLASNRFEGCQALIIIGAPRRDLRASLADLSALNPALTRAELSDAYQEETLAALEQWVGRLRLLRRQRCALIYAGDVSPPQSAGVAWREEHIKAGRPRFEFTVKVESWARQLLSKGVALTHNLLTDLGATEKGARGVMARLRAQSGTLVKRLAHGELALALPQAPTDKRPPLKSLTQLFTQLPPQLINVLKQSLQGALSDAFKLVDLSIDCWERDGWWPAWLPAPPLRWSLPPP